MSPKSWVGWWPSDPSTWTGTSVFFTCSHKPQERQNEERGSTGKDAQDEAEEGREEDGGPAQEVQEGPRPSGRLDLLPWEYTGLLVHLLQGILRVKGRGQS